MLGKGSNSHGSGASISCVGATNSVTLYDARLIEPDENTIPASRQLMYINGVSTDILPDFLESIFVPPPSFPPPSGYQWVNSEVLRNASAEDVRLEFVYEPINQNMKRTILANNPTIIEFNDNRSGVCLSRTVENLQSCNFEWITIENMLAWSSVSAYESQLQTWFKLENVETNETIAFKECNGTNDSALIAAAFEEFLLQINASMKISAELVLDAWAGVNRFNLVNTSASNLQLRYSATIGNEGDLIVVDGEGNVSEEFNPTQFDRYKEVRFCIAPNTPSCIPVGAELLEVPYQSTANTYFAQYRLNGGAIQRVEFIANEGIAASDLAYELFGQIQDEHEVMLFAMDGGTHICPFYAYHFQYEVRSANSSLNPSEDRPTTLEFMMNPNIEGIDAIQLYFGEDVTLHACSYKEWPAS